MRDAVNATSDHTRCNCSIVTLTLCASTCSFFSLYMELIHAERSHLHHPDDLNTTFIIISNSSDKCGYRDRKQKHYLRCLEIVTLREWGRKRCKFDGKNERQGAIDTSMTITINAVPSRRIQQLTWSASSLECISKWPRRD